MTAALPDNWPVMTIEQANAALAASESPLKLGDAVVDGVPMKVYVNAPPTIASILQFADASHPEREFLIYQDERVTFGAFARAVEHFAKALVDTYGVEKGDRVAIIARNYPQWVTAFFAASAAGAIVTPMNSWWTGDELEYGLSDSGAKVAIVGPRILDRIKPNLPNLPGLKHVIAMRDANEPDMPGMADHIGPVSEWGNLPRIGLPAVTVSTDDDATIMYTSGTTGRPKGAVASHRGIVSNFLNGMTSQARMFLRRGEPIPEPGPETLNTILLSVPYFHATGAFAALMPTVLKGDKIITMYKWDPTEALGIIQDEKVTAFGGVPAIAWQVLEHPERHLYDLSSIRAVSYGGAPSAPELVTTIKKTFKEAHAGNGWGMTETCATATSNFGDDYVNRPDSAGAPAGAVELKIVGPDGQEVPQGEVGELWCKGPMNAKSYWNKPEATAETFRDGWVVTGDLARLDEDGFVYIVDRAKDMLIRGGENVYCIEVENVLFEHPSVVDAAIVGIEHKVLGEEVGAVVQVKPGAEVSQEELRAFVGSQLAAFKVPVEIQFMNEPLPRNANGKVLKMDLRKRFSPRL